MLRHKPGKEHGKMNFKNLLPVSKPVLFFTAGLLWMLAGINILRIGIEAFSACLHQGKVALLPTVFFAVFYNGLGSALCFVGLMFVKYLKR